MMESDFQPVFFVRCPKCLRLLAEFPEIPIFKCYGCEAILNAKVHSDGCSSEIGVAIHVEQISVSPESMEEEAEMSNKECSSDGEKKINDLEFTGNEIKSLFISESNDLNQKVEKSSDLIVPVTNDSLNSSCEFEQSPEFLDPDIKSDNEAIEELRNDMEFRLRNRSSHVYDRSFSLLDRPPQDKIPHKHLTFTRRTLSTKVLSSVNSINGSTTTKADKHYKNFSIRSNGNRQNFLSQSKLHDQGTKFRRPDKVYQEKILDKIDNLKIALHRMFSRKSEIKNTSSFSIRATSHTEDEIASSDSRSSSLVHLSRQTSKPSFVLHHNAGKNRHEGNRRVRQDSQIRHCRPVSGGAPFVICYKCYKLLQLPIDFLISSKRIHKLRCGFCSQVLVYSFRPRSRAVLNRR